VARTRIVARRVADLQTLIGADIARLRSDAGLTVASLAREAGIDPGYLWRIEHGRREATIGALAAIADPLGADLAIRLYPNTGPRVRDRHQAGILERVLELVDRDRWTTSVEVAVRKPARGSIDLVLHDRAARLIVATEIESLLRRIEQLLRWHQDKAVGLPSADLWPFAAAEGEPRISRLLIVRSTAANREIARQFEHVLAAAYPGRSAAARAALTGIGAFPGPAILWADIRNGVVTILEGPPRGVSVGR
jgi:transcriptional regulator with XRE-family HTH domain